MPINAAFHRTARPFVGGDYMTSGSWYYVMHPQFAVEPEHYIRAARVLQKDLLELFDYIEPADQNLPTYSFRTHELLLRTCVEIEANCKAILHENGYARAGRWDVSDFRKIERSHFLSLFEAKLTTWRGAQRVLRPFQDWAANKSPGWYDAYNTSKHDRHHGFHAASFGNLIEAMSGLVILLTAQFCTHDFEPTGSFVTTFGLEDDFEGGVGGLFRVKFPTSIPDAERYAFDGAQIAKAPGNPFHKFQY